MEKKIGDTRVTLRQGDITHEEVDVIVNAANSGLLGGGGVDGAIHHTGGPGILEECKKIRQAHGRCHPGQAVITTAGELHAKHVVHTVGPVWHGGKDGEPELLRDAYLNSLKLAAENGAKSIAFPSISTGAYGFPIRQAAPIALQAVKDFAAGEEQIQEVRFVLFSENDFNVFEDALEKV